VFGLHSRAPLAIAWFSACSVVEGSVGLPHARRHSEDNQTQHNVVGRLRGDTAFTRREDGTLCVELLRIMARGGVSCEGAEKHRFRLSRLLFAWLGLR
jgi:hypothetical protein